MRIAGAKKNRKFDKFDEEFESKIFTIVADGFVNFEKNFKKMFRILSEDEKKVRQLSHFFSHCFFLLQTRFNFFCHRIRGH